MMADYNSTPLRAYSDSTPPTVQYKAPAAGSIIGNNTNIAYFFSEQMDTSTVTDSYMNLGGTSCPNGTTVQTFDDGWGALISCIGSIGGGATAINWTANSVRDRHNPVNSATCENTVGNMMTSDASASYTCSGSPDTTPPTVPTVGSPVYPPDGTTGVSTTVTPYVQFSEPVDPTTVTPTSVFLIDQYGMQVNAKATFNNASLAGPAQEVQLRLPTGGSLAADTRYYIIVTTAVRDLAGNAYNGAGGELVEKQGVLRTCFSTGSTPCP
jgi:hypothetical protein